jgi:hypothetical protein
MNLQSVITFGLIILWHVDPLPGNDREISDYTTAPQTIIFPRQQLNSNRGTVFSVRSVPRCSKQDKSLDSVDSVSELVGE